MERCGQSNDNPACGVDAANTGAYADVDTSAEQRGGCVSAFGAVPQPFNDRHRNISYVWAKTVCADVAGRVRDTARLGRLIGGMQRVKTVGSGYRFAMPR